MARTATISPIHNPLMMYQIHRFFSEMELNKTFIETRALQTAIRELLPYIPDGKNFISLVLLFRKQHGSVVRVGDLNVEDPGSNSRFRLLTR